MTIDDGILSQMHPSHSFLRYAKLIFADVPGNLARTRFAARR